MPSSLPVLAVDKLPLRARFGAALLVSVVLHLTVIPLVTRLLSSPAGGVPAAGGFMLCDKRAHARDDFTLGQNWAEFDGLDDCVAQIDHWLANFDAARTLAERAHLHVMTHHTYAVRAETLHHALLAWHEGKRGRLA